MHSTNGIPDGYTGKVITVMACPGHGAHVNLDFVVTPNDAWESAKELAAASTDTSKHLAGGIPMLIDQMSPEQAEEFAADLMEAAAKARDQIAAHAARKN